MYMYNESMLTRSVILNHLCECHQFYNFDAVGDTDELIRFEFKGQGQGNSETANGQISS